jgi:hypothetical protein
VVPVSLAGTFGFSEMAIASTLETETAAKSSEINPAEACPATEQTQTRLKIATTWPGNLDVTLMVKLLTSR